MREAEAEGEEGDDKHVVEEAAADEGADPPQGEPDEEEGEGGRRDEGKSEGGKMVYKIHSCSECGLKTPSRMTYIQHVLSGCMMDLTDVHKRRRGGSGRGRGRGRGRPPAGGRQQKAGSEEPRAESS